ncbi:uncharacterized protein [Penaeus vannamei]|uniref:uncharacterized protein n=1 Tax=Penaeus vannamei TaxID=6689 RepID=UPI00387F9409
MASAKARTSFLLLLLHIFPAAPFEILRDCIVSSQITESNILFDTLEFLALVPDGRTGIRARISCADDQYHYIEWNSQRITATTTSTFGPYGAPDSSNGWTRFTLGYVGHLTLFDGRRQSWLPGNISFQCPVSNVELSGSFFTRMCPTSTPVWKVEGKGSVDIPLHVDDETPENLTLFSTTNFRPVFRVDDSEFHLGMSGESLMTGRHHEPLFGGTDHRLVLKTYKENGSTMFQVLSAGLPIHTESLKEVPKRMRVQSQDGHRFVLVQNLGSRWPWYTREARNPHDNTEGQCNETAVCLGSYAVIAGLGILALALAAALLCQGRQSCCCSKSAGAQRPASPTKQEAHPVSPQYLEPVALRPSQPQPPVPLLSPRASRIHASLTDHLYEELEETNPRYGRRSSSELGSSSSGMSLPSDE